MLRVHDPINWIVEQRRMTATVSFVFSSTPFVVPRVGDEIDIGQASYAEAAKARQEAQRVRVVTRVAHYIENSEDRLVDHVDVYTEWRPIVANKPPQEG